VIVTEQNWVWIKKVIREWEETSENKKKKKELGSQRKENVILIVKK